MVELFYQVTNMHDLSYNKNNLIENTKLLIDDSMPIVTNLANMSRLIYESLNGVSWCGFYLSNNTNNCLYLGPFQGPVACGMIPYGKGVCGTSAHLKQTLLVPNVHEYPGHIACSSLTNSEIVIPILKDNKCVGVLDLDSNNFDNFNLEEQLILEEVCSILSKLF